MALPNCRRSFTYFSAASSAPRPIPSASAAMEIRAAVQNAHRVDEAFAFRAQQVFLRDFAVLKDQLAGIAGAQAQLVFFLPRAESLRPLLDDKGRQPMRPFALVGYGDDHRIRRRSARW